VFPFLHFLVPALVLYAVVRIVTRDEHLDLWPWLVWYLIVWAAGMGAYFAAGPNGLGLPDTAREVARVVVGLAALTVILWHQGFSRRRVWTIIGIFSVVPIVILILMLME